VSTNSDLLAIFDKAAAESGLGVDEAHVAGLRAVAAAAWDEGWGIGHDYAVTHEQGSAAEADQYGPDTNPHRATANALVVPPQDQD